MKKIVEKVVCILLILICCLPLVSGSSDDAQSVSCPYPLRQLTMYDEKTGWALSMENEILFTENGIGHFEPVRSLENADSASDRFASAAFLDQRTAYTACFSFDDNQLIVERTQDSGASWQQTFIDFADYADICDVGSIFLSFIDNQQGYLLCCSTPAAGLMTKLLFFTDNAGKTFYFISDLTNIIAGYPQGITAVSEGQLYIAVTYHGIDACLYQSSDSARTWKRVEIFPRTEDVRYVDGYAPIFYDSGGQTGTILLNVRKEQAVCQLYTTKDAGDNWTLERELPCDTPLSYSIDNSSRIYVIDQDGKVFIFHP
ncbi:MAG: hypothetical protein K2N95_06815 [Lachnospiraceae bacterium]|nr:hypothetical protein [Lachnospiraceae bacterium]